MNSDTKHFRPSSMKRYVNCNLWRWLPAIEETEENKQYLEQRTEDHERLANEDFKVSESRCKQHFLMVKEKCTQLFGKEEKFTILNEMMFGKSFQGTADVFGFSDTELFICDYKTGVSIYEPYHNYQLMCYVILVFTKYFDGKRYCDIGINKIHMSILNVQSDRVLTWSLERNEAFITRKETNFQASYLFEFFPDFKRLASLMRSAVLFNKKERCFSSVGDHCQFCESKHYCPLKSDYTELVEYADKRLDQFIWQMKKHKSQIDNREKAVKGGVHSNLLTPLLGTRIVNVWAYDEIPEKCYVMKKMTPSEAIQKYGDEIQPYLEKKVIKILSSPKKQQKV